MTRQLVLATRNAHKVGELRSILAAAMPGAQDVEILAAGDLGLPDVPETGVTFAEKLDVFR